MRGVIKTLTTVHKTLILPTTSLSFTRTVYDVPDTPITWAGSGYESNSSTRNVVTVYDAVSGRLVTTRVAKPDDGAEDGVLKEEIDYNVAVFDKIEKFVGGVGERKDEKGKRKINWVCSSCGHSEGQWRGSCLSCNKFGTIQKSSLQGGRDSDKGGKINRLEVSKNAVKSWLPPQGVLDPTRLTDVNHNQMTWRIPLSGLFGSEVARVLGGGLVPGSLVLVGGDPGVGKSTLLLQMAAIIAEGVDNGEPTPALYVSGEESVEQIANRAARLNIGTKDLFLYSCTDIKVIMHKTQKLSPRVLIVDSIQTVHLEGVTGSPGGIMQIKECIFSLLHLAKKTNIPVLLIGHVTKSGDIAGPRLLEHSADVVLYMEGEKHSSHRLLRPLKNRFGSTDELGVFEMSPTGLQAVSNPSEIFLTEQQPDSEILAGLAVAVVMNGNQSSLVEIQALCSPGSSKTRQVNGVQARRADMIISVLMKQAGLKIQKDGIFINVVGGVTMSETSGDLAIAAAICSSFLEIPIPSGVAFIGEICLDGEIRPVSRMKKRVNTVVKLGYKKCVVPKSAEKSLEGVETAGTILVGCSNLKEMISCVFEIDVEKLESDDRKQLD